MNKNISKISYALVLLAAAITIFFSCKKTKADTFSQADEATIEKVKKAIVASGKPASNIITVNQPATDVYFSDANNNRIDLKKLLNGPTPNFTAVCDYQVDTNGDPVDDMIPANFNLNSIGFTFDCSPIQPAVYRISFDWSLAVHHQIQANNTYGSGGSMLRSRFTLKIKNAAGTVIATYSNNYISGGNITDLGDWPSDPNRKSYGVTASIEIPSSIFNNGVTYETTVTLATDCNLTPQITMLHTNTSVSSLNSQPCKRTDKVWINGNTGQGGIATAAGTFVVCTPPAGYAITPKHELQYRRKTSTTTDAWDAQNSTIYPDRKPFYTFSTYGITSPIELDHTTPGSGTWIFRYRNSGSCSPTAPAPWVIEKWTF